MNPTQMSQPEPIDLKERVRAVADEAAEARGLYVVDVQLRGQPGSRVVEVYADAEEGVGLDDLAELSRDIGFVLETEDVIKGRYHLNVSSPGADRPLTDRRQFKRHLGRDLKITIGDGDDRQTITGTLVAVNDRSIALEVAGGEQTELPLDEVSEARVQLPW